MHGPDEDRRAIETGAIGPNGMVAWIESNNDIDTLYVSGHGRILLTRSLARADTLDFGYEGCAAEYLAWCGDRVVVVSRERSYYLRVVDPERGSEEGLSFSNAWRIDGDLFVWVEYEPGLLCTAGLPSLDARPPLPFRGAPPSSDIRLEIGEKGRLEVMLSRHAGGRPIDSLGLPTERQRADYAPVDGLLELVERRLFGVVEPPMAARMAIEATAYAFVRGAWWRQRWQPAPAWMPVYWHRHLAATGRTKEANELIRLLDAMADPLAEEEPECGWNPRWNPREGQIELAVRHVRRQARILAEACRKGTLPPKWWCLLFDPAPGSSVPGSRVDPSGFPPTLRRVFEDLVRTGPERFPQRW
jgi:hypothetical protein